MEIKDKIIKMISDIIGIVTIREKETLQDVGLDSLQLVVLLAKIEYEFDIDIPDYELDIKNFETIESIEQLINRMKGV